MPRTHSLSRVEIELLASLRPCVYKGTLITLFVYPTHNSPYLKSIAVVSKKVAPHATDRNRIKRRIREIVRVFVARHEPIKNTIIIRATPMAAKADMVALQAELETLLARAVHTTDKNIR
ncbi:ribonuclease P protein component [Candidatus Kaiserbacteria bacterium]|nr:ribonuclease P protein component [Candidatus Kaiserbacteria bacterium]